MKKFLLALTALLPIGSLIAQTILNQQFGCSPDQVLNFLSTKSNVHVDHREDGSITAAAERYTVTYRFVDGELSTIETVCEFGHRKEAMASLEEMKQQMVLRSAYINDLAATEEATSFEALWNGVRKEVAAMRLSNGAAQLRIVESDLGRISYGSEANSPSGRNLANTIASRIPMP